MAPHTYHAAFFFFPCDDRVTQAIGIPLAPCLAPCLSGVLVSILKRIANFFPPAAACIAAHMAGQRAIDPQQDPFHHLDPSHPSSLQFSKLQEQLANPAPKASGSLESRLAGRHDTLPYQRLLLCGRSGSGQDQLCSALSHALEGTPVFSLSLTGLMQEANGGSIEGVLIRIFKEAER